MKKLIKTLVLAFVAIATVSVFNSCEKEEDELDSYNNEEFDPYNDRVSAVSVEHLSLIGDSVLANVTVYYNKPGSLAHEYHILPDSLFICDSSSITKEFREPEIQYFILRNDSIFKVTKTSTIFHLSRHIIYDSVHKHYNIKGYAGWSSYSLNCIDVVGYTVVEEESFVKVVNDPFGRYYNEYIHGEKFVFVYTECFGPDYKFDVCGGYIALEKSAGHGINVVPLEIVNY